MGPLIGLSAKLERVTACDIHLHSNDFIDEVMPINSSEREARGTIYNSVNNSIFVFIGTALHDLSFPRIHKPCFRP